MSPLLPTPTYNSLGIGAFTVTCATHINASPETCLQVVLDTAKYPEWNRFAPQATIHKQPGHEPDATGTAVLKQGTQFRFHVDMDVGRRDATAPPPPKEALTTTDVLAVTRLGPVDDTADKDREVNAAAEKVLADNSIVGARKARLRVCWASSAESAKTPGWLLRSERVQEFHLVESESGHSATDYVCWESFGGLLAPVVRLAVGSKVHDGFIAWMEGLKKAAEAIDGRKGSR